MAGEGDVRQGQVDSLVGHELGAASVHMCVLASSKTCLSTTVPIILVGHEVGVSSVSQNGVCRLVYRCE